MKHSIDWQHFSQVLKTNYLSSLSVDCVIFGFQQGRLHVLLLRWTGTNEWSLPGGRVGKAENLTDAAHRSLRERTGLDEIFLQHFHTFGDVMRYRELSPSETLNKLNLPAEAAEILTERIVSVGYYALVNMDTVVPAPDIFTDECRWWPINETPDLLFDHNEMLALAIQVLRRQLNYQPIGYSLLPKKFTMTDLQQLYETILEQPLDRRNFQKRMLSYDVLERLNERKAGVAHKAPYLYRFNQVKYAQALGTELFFS